MPSSGWQKSSYSAAHDDCVEVRAVAGMVDLRESDDADVIVRTTPTKFAALLQGIKSGEFDRHATPTT
ncbi:DUF397 domain-containing protein [Streptomyces sp. CB01881]|uniref:DUF397 domain-containing protein n=1 Tax=Streptomyces sp. CB01881 TaxID=2078691 RepID=UPI000CDC8BA2|nr:DUF397 domain-containing protein [Streptomyces sp. CB01881]AUY51069.1 DUF397 domain-containing protein [Streptomyces sp. CB01881]TYC74453.1 DUF397 domain-containing protein [Streptomyces sp. CB01881]